jgi:hypothetical protein
MINRIKSLNFRERILVAAAAVFIIALLIIYFIITPSLERSRLLSRLISQKEKEFQELLLLREEYRKLKTAEDEIVKLLSEGKENISPLSQLEQLAQKAGIRGYIQQMKPLSPIVTPRYTITPVQLRFRGAGLKDVTSYLYEIESASLPFKIRRLKLKSMARSAGGLDVTLEIVTFSASGSR